MELRDVSLTVNGTSRHIRVEPRRLLVHCLRQDLGLTGTHVGCDTADCGACVVLLDGRAVKSCNLLAVQADGAAVSTVEGLARDGELHPLQRAFCEKHAVQCGFCTPGMLMLASALLEQSPHPDEAEIRRALYGNLCRCTGYGDIVDAIRYAGDLVAEAGTER
jgi:aerobic carbon-monoxide dehydrogenase small subunit